MKDNAINDLDLDDEEIFKAIDQIFLVLLVKNNLSKVLNDSDIRMSDYTKVFDAAHYYFKHTLK